MRSATRPAWSALEQQMLEVVRGAGQGGCFVARPHTDPDAEGNRTHRRDGLGDDPQPTGQDGTADDAATTVRARGQSAGGARLLEAREQTDAHYPSAGASPSSMTGCNDSFPRWSISAIWTWTLSPTLTTSSTFSTRLPPAILRSCEMCNRPSLPGVSDTKAPNVVVLTTVPR